MRRKYILVAAAFLTVTLPSFAQTADSSAQAKSFAAGSTVDVLREVEQNNTTLKALRQSADAQKIENLTGIMLEDPEIGFSYLWGGPAAIGNRQDVSVTQTFDFGTLAGMKRKVAQEKNSLVEWEYLSQRMEILLEAELLCIELTHLNALAAVLEERAGNAATIAENQRSKLEHGEGNILEYNNSLLELGNAENSLAAVKAQQEAALSKLAGLNGGCRTGFTATDYAQEPFPADFDSWYAEAQSRNPVLAYVRGEIELSRKELTLSKTGNLPSLSVGYMGEFTLGQRYQGVSLGVSIPLWSNARRVRQAKAAVQAAQSREADAKQQFYSKLEAQYTLASSLKEVAENSRRTLDSADNRALLRKALDEGEISMQDYLVSLGFYYDALERTMNAELEYHKALAELYSYIL